jgi:hypothetical protein
MRVIEHNHFSPQVPANTPPAPHFRGCFAGTPASGPASSSILSTQSIPSTHPFLKGGKRRHPALHDSHTPPLHSANFQRTAPPPATGKRSNRWSSLLTRPPKFSHKLFPCQIGGLSKQLQKPSPSWTLDTFRKHRVRVVIGIRVTHWSYSSYSSRPSFCFVHNVTPRRRRGWPLKSWAICLPSLVDCESL